MESGIRHNAYLNYEPDTLPYFLTAPWLSLQCAIVVFAFHTHLLFDTCVNSSCTVYVYRDRISLVPFRFRLVRPSARSPLYSL